MSIPKLLAVFTFLLFSAIALAGWWKSHQPHQFDALPFSREVEIPISSENTVKIANASPKSLDPSRKEPPSYDRVEELFSTQGAKLPIVETIPYKSRVTWNKGNRAWLSDYAAHYHTSRHFIARSRNGKADYWKQELAEGDRINILKPDLKLQFNLVVDISRNKLWLYAYDLTHQEKIPIKSYDVGLGRVSPTSSSGYLTPLGTYVLGDKILTIKPGHFGPYNKGSVELIRVFGTRWIPFGRELGYNEVSARGFGIHGVPWRENARGELEEDLSSLGKYQSDGCIRLATKDVEEIYAIVITKPCVVEIVRDFYDAVLPIADTEVAVK